MTTRSILEWLEPPAAPLAPDFEHAIGGHPLVARILAQRGFDTLVRAHAFLSPDHYTPAPPDALPDLAIAADHLDHALQRGDSILVWGDFDVDGQTATALFVDGLRRLGAHVSYHIPHRLRDSHGIRRDRLQAELDRSGAALLLTCDTGVSDFDALDYAKSRGVVTLLTDHHVLPPVLPSVDALITPRRLPAGHPLASLPGVGVAYKLVEHLYARRGRDVETAHFLDLVALGIVADIAEQTHDTRYLLQRGLEALRATRRLGLSALVDAAALPADELSAADIAFQLGPRLNAAGRLADAALAVDLLLTTDSTRAYTLALQLEGLNNQRRLLTREILASAEAQIAADPALLDQPALVLFDPTWHAGITGLVAGRLAERHQRPALLLTSAAAPGLARGSARSVPGCDISAALAEHADLLVSYGGHTGAAGFALPLENVAALRHALCPTLAACQGVARAALPIDASVSLGDITPEFAAELHRLGPFGAGNPPVTLAAENLTLRSAAVLGRSREHRRLTIQDAAGRRLPVIWWHAAAERLPTGTFDLALRLEFGVYRDATALQIVLVDWRPSAGAPVAVAPPREILDRRAEPASSALAALLAVYPGAAVWAEGYRQADSPGVPLSALPEAETLIIYTTPSHPRLLRPALEQVQPARIALLAADPPMVEPEDVLRRLLELVKYVVTQQGGRTSLDALAASLGQTTAAVDAALSYLVARGEIAVDRGADHTLQLTPRHATAVAAADRWDVFEALVAETAAYRAFFRRAQPEHIFRDDPA